MTCYPELLPDWNYFEVVADRIWIGKQWKNEMALDLGPVPGGRDNVELDDWIACNASHYENNTYDRDYNTSVTFKKVPEPRLLIKTFEHEFKKYF